MIEFVCALDVRGAMKETGEVSGMVTVPTEFAGLLGRHVGGQVGHVGQPTSLDAVNLTRDGGEVMLLASLGRRWDITVKEEVFKTRDKMTALLVVG